MTPIPTMIVKSMLCNTSHTASALNKPALFLSATTVALEGLVENIISFDYILLCL